MLKAGVGRPRIDLGQAPVESSGVHALDSVVRCRPGDAGHADACRRRTRGHRAATLVGGPSAYDGHSGRAAGAAGHGSRRESTAQQATGQATRRCGSGTGRHHGGPGHSFGQGCVVSDRRIRRPQRRVRWFADVHDHAAHRRASAHRRPGRAAFPRTGPVPRLSNDPHVRGDRQVAGRRCRAERQVGRRRATAPECRATASSAAQSRDPLRGSGRSAHRRATGEITPIRRRLLTLRRLRLASRDRREHVMRIGFPELGRSAATSGRSPPDVATQGGPVTPPPVRNIKNFDSRTGRARIAAAVRWTRISTPLAAQANRQYEAAATVPLRKESENGEQGSVMGYGGPQVWYRQC
jgi:hypothetical protein